MSKLSEIQKRSVKLEMTPMIDVTFLLLVFFMCTLKFKSLEGKLAATLPRDVGQAASDTTPEERIQLRMEVLAAGNRLAPDGGPWAGDGPFVFDHTRQVRYRLGPRTLSSASQLTERLLPLHRVDDSRGLTIDARPGVIYGEVVAAIDATLAVGIRDITFSGALPIDKP